MEDYPNNKTLAAVINAIDQTKADKADIITPVQSNWDVDDENDLAYIKNKPEEITSEEIDRICGMTIISDENNFVDETTGIVYRLYVDNGKLHMTEVE